MTNEELIVMARMADDLINNRRWLIEQRRFNDELMDRVKTAEEDSKKLMAECNRLRESEANALNAAEEAKRERDEAKRRIHDAEYCLKALYFRYRINTGSHVVKIIKEYIEKYRIDIREGGMAK